MERTIHSYASVGDRDGVLSELEKGVSVDARDEHDFTPLARAVSSAHETEELVRLLIDAGADVNSAVDQGGTVPIVLAAQSGSIRKIQLLLNAGADIGFRSRNGYTILINIMFALHDDELLVPMTEFLLRNGAEADCKTDYGESPLSVASCQGRFGVVRLLLDAGADPAPIQWTELMRAVALGTVADTQRLLEEGCRIDEHDRWGRTAWLLTAVVGDIEKAQLLHAAGAALGARDRGGNTALMTCAGRENVEMMRWLIEVGADLEEADDSGNSPLIIAAQAGSAECVRVLLEAGADPRTRNEYEKNAMSLASSEPVIRLLAEAGEEIADISTEMKRTLTGLQDGDALRITTAEYWAGSRRRFGDSNPQVMDVPFWQEMVRAGISAYQAKTQFDDADNMEHAAWCFSRYGMSFTELPDGRFVQIGGEHEDYYDPDFCIYNDVVINERSGDFRILGYPLDVFPPTDFHSATYVDGVIYIIGRLGYQGTRVFGTTPIYRLDCKTWQIESVTSNGHNPGWIFRHKSRLADRNKVVISGGEICNEVKGQEELIENSDEFCLDLSTMNWTRL